MFAFILDSPITFEMYPMLTEYAVLSLLLAVPFLAAVGITNKKRNISNTIGTWNYTGITFLLLVYLFLCWKAVYGDVFGMMPWNSFHYEWITVVFSLCALALLMLGGVHAVAHGLSRDNGFALGAFFYIGYAIFTISLPIAFSLYSSMQGDASFIEKFGKLVSNPLYGADVFCILTGICCGRLLSRRARAATAEKAFAIPASPM